MNEYCPLIREHYIRCVTKHWIRYSYITYVAQYLFPVPVFACAAGAHAAWLWLGHLPQTSTDCAAKGQQCPSPSPSSIRRGSSPNDAFWKVFKTFIGVTFSRAGSRCFIAQRQYRALLFRSVGRKNGRKRMRCPGLCLALPNSGA